MNARFKQAVRIENKTFPLGIHEVPKNILDHPHFQRYVDCGWIVDISDKASAPQETVQERNKRLHEKLQADAELKKAEAELKAGDSEKSDDTDFGDGESESESEESESLDDDEIDEPHSESESEESKSLDDDELDETPAAQPKKKKKKKKAKR